MAKTATAKAHREASRRSTPAAWSHGTFHWNELRTRDAERAKKFYRDTIGWTFEACRRPTAGPIGAPCEDGKPVAGLFPLTSPQFDDVPESWMSFLAVDDVDKRVAKADQGRRQARDADLRRAGRRPHRHADGAGRRRHRLDDAGRQVNDNRQG